MAPESEAVKSQDARSRRAGVALLALLAGGVAAVGLRPPPPAVPGGERLPGPAATMAPTVYRYLTGSRKEVATEYTLIPNGQGSRYTLRDGRRTYTATATGGQITLVVREGDGPERTLWKLSEAGAAKRVVRSVVFGDGEMLCLTESGLPPRRERPTPGAVGEGLDWLKSRGVFRDVPRAARTADAGVTRRRAPRASPTWRPPAGGLRRRVFLVRLADGKATALTPDWGGPEPDQVNLTPAGLYGVAPGTDFEVEARADRNDGGWWIEVPIGDRLLFWPVKGGPTRVAATGLPSRVALRSGALLQWRLPRPHPDRAEELVFLRADGRPDSRPHVISGIPPSSGVSGIPPSSGVTHFRGRLYWTDAPAGLGLEHGDGDGVEAGGVYSLNEEAADKRLVLPPRDEQGRRRTVRELRRGEDGLAVYYTVEVPRTGGDRNDAGAPYDLAGYFARLYPDRAEPLGPSVPLPDGCTMRDMDGDAAYLACVESLGWTAAASDLFFAHKRRQEREAFYRVPFPR